MPLRSWDPTVNPSTAATIDDLYRIRGKAELVRGQIVLMPPFDGLVGRAVGRIIWSLHGFASRAKRGHAGTSTLGIVVDLPNRKSFCPDASYYVGKLTMKFVDGAPAFAVEVRSDDDYGPAGERKMGDKRADYFAAGTLVVWDVDLQGDDVIRVFRASDPERPAIYRHGEIAEAEPAVPDWTMAVDGMFPPDDEAADSGTE
jgi:Uma2 family endonuclease